MGILKDHIPIISFLKPGIIDVKSKNDTLNFYVDDGIVEFKDNNLSILTSNIFDLKNFDKNNIDRIVKNAEEDLKKENINDQERFILDQKIEVLNSLKFNPFPF
jgi:F0F1-type ATP synthase epsilon subunit